MGKGELWDDSALINAFDEAISKYKKMHGKGYKDTSIVELESDNEDASTILDAIQEDIRHLGIIDSRDSNASHATVEVKEVENLGATKGNEVSESQGPEEHALGSNSLPFQDQAQDHTPLTLDEYNQLYAQYYEVEKQRQYILQKLQFSGWNYSDAGGASVYGSQWGTNSATQEYQSSSNQAPCGTVVCCCSCACPFSTASCNSLPCASPGAHAGTHSDDAPAPIAPGKLPGVEDADFVKTALGAAERAISTLKDKTSDWKEDNKIGCTMKQSASSETDLCDVLNAWYSAGFHTGKYLMEQSLAKKQHG